MPPILGSSAFAGSAGRRGTSATMIYVDHAVGVPSDANCVLIRDRDRQLSNFGSEQFDEHGVRLIRDRAAMPCRMRKIWGTLALLQFLTAAALLITDIYGEQ